MKTYSIKELEILSGVKAHTIRMWEKRYNVFQPIRTDTNIRMYTEQELKKILNVALLNRLGFKISKIIKLEPEELSQQIIQLHNVIDNYDKRVDMLISEMLELNEKGIMEIIDNAIESFGVEETILSVFFPFLEKTGALWQASKVLAAEEHYTTSLLRQRIIGLIDQVKPVENNNPKRYMVFLPEEVYHELPVLFAIYMLKKSGHQVIYLGQNVPADDVIQIGKKKHPDFMFTFITSSFFKKSNKDYMEKIVQNMGGTTLFVSGMRLLPSYFPQAKNFNFLQSYRQIREVLLGIQGSILT